MTNCCNGEIIFFIETVNYYMYIPLANANTIKMITFCKNGNGNGKWQWLLNALKEKVKKFSEKGQIKSK